MKTISYHAAPSQAAALASMLLAATTLQAVTPAASAPSPQFADALSTIVADRFTTASARGVATARGAACIKGWDCAIEDANLKRAE